jgi:hypothetical protein
VGEMMNPIPATGSSFFFFFLLSSCLARLLSDFSAEN